MDSGSLINERGISEAGILDAPVSMDAPIMTETDDGQPDNPAVTLSPHTQVINAIAKHINAIAYLEIGLSDPALNYDHIDVVLKECVDPFDSEISDIEMTPDKERHINDVLTYRMTSDEMFKKIPSNKKFDVIFIDGLHEGLQVYKDFINSYNHLSIGGVIIVHDCMPPSEKLTRFPRETAGPWFGTSWKAIPALKEYNNIDVPVLAAECGMGIFIKTEDMPTTLKKTCRSVKKYEYKNIGSLINFVSEIKL